MTDAYEDYQQLRVLKQPLTGVYLSFFLMLTLMILVASTWMGLYLAKRITRPVQMLAAAADEIGAGHLDYRVECRDRDEFGSLVEAFNRMAATLPASRRRLERSAVELEAQAPGGRGRRRVRGDGARACRHGRDVGRRGRAHPHVELGGLAPARYSSGTVTGLAGLGGVRRAGVSSPCRAAGRRAGIDREPRAARVCW